MSGKQPFFLQVLIFLLCFLGLASYMVGGLETEDGQALLVIILGAGIISTLRALYLKNRELKQRKH